MATVVEKANAYFPSVSNLAARVFTDVELVKQACMASGEWEELSVEEQELITDQVLIDSQVLERYSSSATTNGDEQHPECFPVLRLASGEKIVVDFENDDGCTWADEHSGPFSWKTKSQQDLSLDDLDDSSGSKDGQSKKGRFTKRLRSPDRSIWDTSLFFPGGGSKNEIEKMFEKFKIKMAEEDEDGVSADNPEVNGTVSAVKAGLTDSDFSPAHNEYSKLIGGVNKAYAFSVDDVKHVTNVRDTKQDEEQTGQKKKKKHKKDKHHSKERKSQHGKSSSAHGDELDNAVAIPAETPPSFHQLTTQQSDDSVFGTASYQTSEVDVLNSSRTRGTESAELDLPSVHASCHMSDTRALQSDMGVIGSVDVNPLDYSTDLLDYSTAELIPPTPTKEIEAGSRRGTLKSGFDFLDEW